MTSFDTGKLLGLILPTSLLLGAYIGTFFFFTARDYKKVRSVYKEVL